MDASLIQDRVARGMGRAALAMGESCDAFRPRGTELPLSPERRFLRLRAWFGPPKPDARMMPEYGHALWWATVDSAYLKHGDYLRRADGAVWFVAACEKLLPVLCVRAGRVVELLRPAAASRPGRNAYGGTSMATAATLISGWPASVLTAGAGVPGSAGLPADVPLGAWEVLLPTLPGVVPQNGDLLRDDLGRTGTVASTELSSLGWRLIARQAAA
jgi:hypothetical protein